jgi:hypothetical protein
MFMIWGPRADMPCDMDFSMYYSFILFIIYYMYQAKIAVVNENKILKYLRGPSRGLSAQRDRASAKCDVSSVLFDVTMQNLYWKKLTLSFSQRKDT